VRPNARGALNSPLLLLSPQIKICGAPENKVKRKEKNMIVELIIPIEELRGQLRKEGYYYRMWKGKQIVQRCPTKWKDTPARKAAREKFIEKYGKKKSKG